MRRCMECSKLIDEGHVMYEGSFYLCVECFKETYTPQEAQEMYDNEEQYYTEWYD